MRAGSLAEHGRDRYGNRGGHRTRVASDAVVLDFERRTGEIGPTAGGGELLLLSHRWFAAADGGPGVLRYTPGVGFDGRDDQGSS